MPDALLEVQDLRVHFRTQDGLVKDRRVAALSTSRPTDRTAEASCEA